MRDAHVRTDYTGGDPVTDLDGIDGDDLSVGELGVVINLTSSLYTVYALLESGAATNGIYVFPPALNAGTKRWHQMQTVWLDNVGNAFLNSTLVKDPKFAPWAIGAETNIGIGYSTLLSGLQVPYINPMSGAAIWTELANWGAVGRVVADNTYVTVANLTASSGLLINLFLPGVTTAADVVTCKLTIDGTEYTLAFTTAAATDRVVMGVIKAPMYSGSGVVFDGSSWESGGFTGLAARCDASLQNFVLQPNVHIASFPVIRFEDSLKVEMKSSDYLTTNARDYCAAVYRLDP